LTQLDYIQEAKLVLSLIPTAIHAPMSLHSLSPGSKLTVRVTVCVVVALLVTVTLVVLVTCPGPEVIKHEQAEEIWLGPPRPSETVSWRLFLRTGSSAGQALS
jgi:hypothetical protein